MNHHQIIIKNINNLRANNLFLIFMRGFLFIDKMISNSSLLSANENIDNKLDQNRNRKYLFILNVSNLYEFYKTIQELNQETSIRNDGYMIELMKINKEINTKYKKLSSKIRNQIGCHDGKTKLFKEGLDKLIQQGDTEFLLANMLIADNNKTSYRFYSSDLILGLKFNLSDSDVICFIKDIKDFNKRSLYNLRSLFVNIFPEYIQIKDILPSQLLFNF